MTANLRPQCLFVTGPLGAGKTQWVRDFIATECTRNPSAKFVVLLAEHGTTKLDDLADQKPAAVVLSSLVLPCLCCPGAANLPGVAQELAESANADWVIAEVPTIMAVGLVAETERLLNWSCQLVAVFPTDDPVKQQRLSANVPFFGRLFARADAIVRDEASAAKAIRVVVA